MRADDLLEILKPVSAQIDEERLPALGRLFQDLADGFFDEPSRAPYLSRGAGRALTDRTETGELRWLRLGRQSGRRLLRELYSRCAPRSVWDVFHRWQGEVYYTVLRRPLSQDLPRGSTFSPGLRTRPAWMSPACSGWRMSLWGWRICARGSFLRNCWTSSSPGPPGRPRCLLPGPGRRPWSADTATCFRRPLNNTAGAWAETAGKRRRAFENRSRYRRKIPRLPGRGPGAGRGGLSGGCDPDPGRGHCHAGLLCLPLCRGDPVDSRLLPGGGLRRPPAGAAGGL